MRTLYLHVGHDKTGSSYLQSALARSVDVLLDNGVLYPADRKILRAGEGKISSGNGGIITSDLSAFSDSMDRAKSILVSGEKLFRFMPELEFSDSFSNFLSFFDISRVEILLYVREPLEHISSSYQQAVKRGGYTDTIENFASTYNHTKKVADFVRFCEGKDYNLTVLNYSKISTSLLSTFEKWLNLKDGFLIQPDIGNINRSLTFGELEFQLAANKHFGRRASFLSDQLCQKLPNLKSDLYFLDTKTQAAVLDRIKKHCNYINSRVRELNNNSESYELELVQQARSERLYSFSLEQIEVIANSFSFFSDES